MLGSALNSWHRGFQHACPILGAGSIDADRTIERLYPNEIAADLYGDIEADTGRASTRYF